jgi:hypothetical protein
MSGNVQGHGRAELRERPKMMTQIAVEIFALIASMVLSGREKYGGKPSRPWPTTHEMEEIFVLVFHRPKPSPERALATNHR